MPARTAIRSAVALLVALSATWTAGCGGGQGHSNTVSREGTLRGCHAEYYTEEDVTASVVMVGGERLAIAMMPGDSWTGTCPGSGSALLESQRSVGPSADSVMVTLDPSIRTPVNINDYGRGVAAGMRERYQANGFSIFHESAEAYSSDVYTHFLGLEKNGEQIIQIHIQRVVSVPEGLVVFHYIVISANQDHMTNVGAQMINAAEASDVVHVSELEG